jgi:hypothetical protein
MKLVSKTEPTGSTADCVHLQDHELGTVEIRVHDIKIACARAMNQRGLGRLRACAVDLSTHRPGRLYSIAIAILYNSVVRGLAVRMISWPILANFVRIFPRTTHTPNYVINRLPNLDKRIRLRVDLSAGDQISANGLEKWLSHKITHLPSPPIRLTECPSRPVLQVFQSSNCLDGGCTSTTSLACFRTE